MIIEEKKLDTSVQIRYQRAAAYGGFGLWWFVAIAMVTLGEEHLSETAMLWLMGGWIAYALFNVSAVFWTGYSKNSRQIVNASPEERKKHISEVLWSACGTFICMFAYRRIFSGENSLIWDLIFSIVLAIGTAGFTYLVQIRKLRSSQAHSR